MCDLLAHGVDGLLQLAPGPYGVRRLVVGLTHRLRGDSGMGAPGGTDGDARGRGQRTSHPRLSGRRCDLALVEVATRQLEDLVEALAGLAAGDNHLDAVARLRSQGGNPADAGGRHGASAVAQVGELNGGVEPAYLSNKPGRGSGMQALRVADDEGSTFAR
jgi:hypothetical protein